MSDIEMKSIITTAEIERVHGNARFGNMDKREVVNQGLLKHACGFYQGHTSLQIITDHGLVNGKKRRGKLTRKGEAYLWAAFRTEPSI